MFILRRREARLHGSISRSNPPHRVMRSLRRIARSTSTQNRPLCSCAHVSPGPLLPLPCPCSFVLYLDADMLIRRPIVPSALGAKKGTVVSEHVMYLENGCAPVAAECTR